MRRTVRALLIVLIAGASSCSTRPNQGATGSLTVASSTTSTDGLRSVAPGPAAPLGRAGCNPASSMVLTSSNLYEVQGTTSGGSLFGLVGAETPVIHMNDEVKIVWNMTGVGDLQATATAPSGISVPLVVGPTPHTSSSYGHPGDEWGTVYWFSQDGCWRLSLQRGEVRGDVWLAIAPPTA